MNHNPDTVVIVFAKAPQPGKVKTRLIPSFGARNAAQIHTALVEHTLSHLHRDCSIPVQLWCAPDSNHDFFKQCHLRWPVSLHRQQGQDLGQRMQHALSQALQHYPNAIIVGTDCPAMDAELVQHAARCLQQGCDAVLAPADDGGYVLLGVRQVHPALFQDIAWGTDSVLQSTEKRLIQLGWHWQRLTECWDVDRPEDVTRLWRYLQNQVDAPLMQALEQSLIA
ncbi:MAG: TIGR04282 family arsenosugar biosynthesis glycosyltransferase [Gammaproteobacteria bacterium]|nr:TIGR04282 family arsenosugar biosynthesis glycosyltransferase [Gammaproteobacteria bacterium]MDH5800509.1 TIGR04282 family arsenosugar biosynthesis glycosyltransferase [Gammaproteobacteria bacterium]